MADNGLPSGFQLDQQTQPDQSGNSDAPPPGFDLDEDKYGGLANQAAAGVLGVGEGLAGPVATAVARGLGASPEYLRGIKAANPITHGAGQAAGLVGSALIPGLGEANLAGVAGNIGEHAAALLPEATGALSKIAQTGVKAGAEMATLQASDEISKAITEDPNQSLQSAAINVGLSGLIGGAGGPVIGSVSPLWNKALNKIGVEKLASDYMGETKFLNENPDLVGGAAQEINDRIATADRLINGGLKGDLVDKLTQGASPENVQAHIDSINEAIENVPTSLKKEPIFQEAVANWEKRIGLPEASESPDGAHATVQREEVQEPLPNLRRPTLGRDELGRIKAVNIPPTLDGIAPEVTTVTGEQPGLFSPEALQSNPSYNPSEVFRATEDLKRQLQEWGQYNKALVPIGERPFRDASRSLATGLKESLEDSKIWGAAGDAQQAYNKAVSPLFDAQKEFLGKFASKEMGERVADPTKINTYLNQSDKSKAGLKSNYVKNYLDQTQAVADALNSKYLENGLQQPFEDKLNPTPILNHSLNTPPSPGVSLARWVKNKGSGALGNALGEAGAGAVGGGLGAIVGHPIVGAWMGEKLLSPVFSAFAKPLAESAINSEAAKGATDYIGHVIKGQKTLGEAVGNFFKPGAQVLTKDLIPDYASKDKLERSLEYAQNPSNLGNAGGNISHYLPQHATAAATTASIASNYFAALKPKQAAGAPLDGESPTDKAQQAIYERQLGIAQQPLLILKHAKDGTLLPQDLQTVRTIYPNLLNQIASKLGQEMVRAKAEGASVPYQQRLALSEITGYPVDSTMSQPSIQSILISNAPKAMPQPQVKPKKVSQSTAKSMEKVNALYSTPEQSRSADRLAGTG